MKDLFGIVYAGIGLLVAILYLGLSRPDVPFGWLQILLLGFAALCFFISANYFGFWDYREGLNAEDKRFGFGILYSLITIPFVWQTVVCLASNDTILDAPLMVVPAYYFVCNAVDCFLWDEPAGLPRRLLLRNLKAGAMAKIFTAYVVIAVSWYFSYYYCIKKFNFNDDSSYPWNSTLKLLHRSK